MAVDHLAGCVLCVLCCYTYALIESLRFDFAFLDSWKQLRAIDVLRVLASCRALTCICSIRVRDGRMHLFHPNSCASVHYARFRRVDTCRPSGRLAN